MTNERATKKDIYLAPGRELIPESYFSPGPGTGDPKRYIPEGAIVSLLDARFGLPVCNPNGEMT